MTKDWVNQKKQEQTLLLKRQVEILKNDLFDIHMLCEDDINAIVDAINGDWNISIFEIIGRLKHSNQKNATEYNIIYTKLSEILEKYNNSVRCLYNNWENFIDSEPIEFDGDIIITDPCYITKDNDWEYSEYGERLDKLGIKNFMVRDTLYGDWSCTTFDMNTRKKIGQFCADAGRVMVASLDEILKYNPNFDYHINRKWTTTLIKNFKGTVQFVVKEIIWHPEEDCGLGKKGEWLFDYEVEVIGHGKNKKTGKAIDFIGRQTGL